MNFLRKLFTTKPKQRRITKDDIRAMARWKRRLEFRLRMRDRFAIGGSPVDRRLMRNARKRERAAL